MFPGQTHNSFRPSPNDRKAFLSLSQVLLDNFAYNLGAVVQIRCMHEQGEEEKKI